MPNRTYSILVALIGVFGLLAVVREEGGRKKYESEARLHTSSFLLPPSQQQGFAHPGFRAAWERTDRPVAAGEAKRPWVWGPSPGRSLTEPFAGLPNNSHLVQYFDKGRMELNNPNANPADPFYITNGLLTVELVSGMMRTGSNAFERRGPAHINLASDADDPTAPTYASFNGVSGFPGAPNQRRAANRVGQVVRTAIDRLGVSQPWPQANPDYGVRIVYYEEQTGHNIPDVFWEYLTRQDDIYQNGQLVRGPLFHPWFVVTGYPISEPYWSYVKVSGRYTDVLVQAYERRVLTFAPHLPEPFKVQMGNIGMHYYEWRYTSPRATPRPGGPTPTSPARPPLARITIDEIVYRKEFTDLNGNFAIITNRDQVAHSLNGWWLDSPKWTHVERFYFPSGVTIRPGASIRVRSGAGRNTAEDIYMFRTTVMWDGELYDLAVLYDNYGREVSRFFPASEVGVPPTQPPPPGTVPPAISPTRVATTPARTPTARTGTVPPTSTGGVPSPVSTAPTRIATASVTVSATAGTGTATLTPTATATRTPTP